MAVIVTGATGTLGQFTVRRLLAEGLAVRVLTRRPLLAVRLFGADVGIYEWHPYSEDVPADALAGACGVVHLMGAPFSDLPVAGRDALAISSRVESTRRLVAALHGRHMRLVVVSPAIGDGGGRDGAEGAVRPEPVEGLAPVERLLAWEEIALDAGCDSDGPSVGVVQLGLLAHPSEPLATLVRLARIGVVPRLASAGIGAITPGDAAAMLSGLLARGDLSGVFWGVAPSPVSGQALAAALGQLRPASLPGAIGLPAPLVRWTIARRLGPMAPMLTAERAVQPIRLLEAGASFETPDPTADLLAAIESLAQEQVPSALSELVKRAQALVAPAMGVLSKRGLAGGRRLSPQGSEGAASGDSATGSGEGEAPPSPPRRATGRDGGGSQG